MAFKELTPREIELLTEAQRQTYEEELENYRQRVRFVEQMERLEGTPIKPYKPVLKPIAPVAKAPEKKIGKVENEVHQVVAVRKVAPKVDGIKLPVFEAPKLPDAPVQVKPRVIAVQKRVDAPPEIPVAAAIRIPQTSIQKTEPVKAELNAVHAIRVPNVELKKAEPVNVKLDAMEKLHIKTYPKIAVDQETLKSQVTAVLAVKIPETVVPVLPDVHPDLPKAPVAVVKVRTRQMAVPKMAALPEVPVALKSGVAYQKPDISAAVVRKAYVPVVPQKEYQKAEPVPLNIPAYTPVRVKPKAYSAPKVAKAEVPTSVRVEQKIDWDFEQPEIMVEPAARPVAISAPQITYEKGDCSSQPLPDFAAVDLPDPDPQVNNIIQLLLLEVKKI